MDSYEQACDASAASGGAPATVSFDADPSFAGPAADSRRAGPVKRTIFKYLQPAILLAILAFWSLAHAHAHAQLYRLYLARGGAPLAFTPLQADLAPAFPVQPVPPGPTPPVISQG